MFEIDRRSATPYQTAQSGNLVLLRRLGTDQAHACATMAGTQRRAMVVPVLLVLILAVGTIALRPDAAQLCAKMEDFPCGP